MTVKILKSHLDTFGITPDAFEKAVKKHIKAKMDHRGKEGEPAPTASPLIEKCIKRIPPSGPDTFEADYEIVDDSPPPKTLAERKAELIALIGREEQAAMEALMPMGKRRLRQFEIARIQQIEPGTRTDRDKALLKEQEELDEMGRKVALHAARQQAAVEDLTEETIDNWKPAEFK